MNSDSLDSQPHVPTPRHAPPVGRALRILVGLLLMILVAPVYFRVDAALAIGALLLVLGLVGVYRL
jgi:hypothetical protein